MVCEVPRGQKNAMGQGAGGGMENLAEDLPGGAGGGAREKAWAEAAGGQGQLSHKGPRWRVQEGQAAVLRTEEVEGKS